ncbi:MAG TPA: alpha/beta fold hydrolase, partial [Ktedonobacterales bacterium]|nr:alpha/beta fold hydrolase [Ktedonobacterales bacterium]
FVLPVGAESNYPLFVIHGGPGLDHTEMSPWLDSLSDTFRLLYIDLRGQGRSQRVDPATLTLSRFALDVTKLAEALGLRQYAVLGHSFGSFVALAHAIEQGGASHYVLSGCTASFSKSGPEIQHNLATFEPVALRDQVTQSWALEPRAQTQEDVAKIMEMQMPFHFATTQSDAYRRYMGDEAQGRAIYSPEVLAYFAANEYAIEYEDQLGKITKPALVVTGEYDRTCTPRASRDLHAGIPGCELVIVPNAGHMTYVEQPDVYFPAVRAFFARNGAA